MNIIQRLANLANTLDEKGLYKEADKIDDILKESGISDWLKEFFMGEKAPDCSCNCESCQYARSAYNRPAIAMKHHMKCTQGCPIKAAKE